MSLSGAVRPVAHAVQRLKEAQKLGFGRAMLPAASIDRQSGFGPGLTGVDQLAGLVASIAASGPKGARAAEGGGRRLAVAADDAVRS